LEHLNLKFGCLENTKISVYTRVGRDDFSRPNGRLKPPLPDVYFIVRACLPVGRGFVIWDL